MSHLELSMDEEFISEVSYRGSKHGVSALFPLLSSPLLISSLTLSAEPSLGRSAVFQQAVHVLQGALAFTLDCLLAFIRWVWAERGRKHYNSISIPPVRSERVIPL